jgi:TPR repeat protein
MVWLPYASYIICSNTITTVLLPPHSSFHSFIESFLGDYARATSLHRGACYGFTPSAPTTEGSRKPHYPACFAYGRALFQGTGIKNNDKAAFFAFERACAKVQHIGACAHMGKMLLAPEGHADAAVGVTRDVRRGVKILGGKYGKGRQRQGQLIIGWLVD